MKQESYHMILTYNLKNTQWNINLFNYYEIIIKSFSILHCLFNCVLPAIYFSCFFPAVFYILKWLLFSPEVFFWFLSFHKVYVISRNFNFHVSEFYCGPLFLFIFGWQTANHNYEQQQKKGTNERVIFFNDSSLGKLPLLAFGFSTLTEQDVNLRLLEGKLVQVVKSYVVILVVVIRLIQRKNHPHSGFEENARLPSVSECGSTSESKQSVFLGFPTRNVREELTRNETNVYFNGSNSTFLNKNSTFIKSKPLFPKVHG